MTQAKHENITVLITGGHLTPALATIEEIQRRKLNWHILFVGRKYALEGGRTVSEEYRIIHTLGIAFLPLTTGRVKRDKSITAIFSFLKIPVGFVQAAYYLVSRRPTVIVSFGGYVAFPIAVVGWLLGIPTMTHEQTTRPGLANRIIARVAKFVAVNSPDAAVQFRNPKKVVVTGLPIRKDILDAPKKSPVALPADKPLLLIVGGSTGSVSINTVIFNSLSKLLAEFVVLHQVGSLSETKALQIKTQLPAAIRDRYVPYVYLPSPLYAWALRHAALVIGRSGANTVMEAAVSGAIAIWIPLPWAARNEQYHNAKTLVDHGSSVMLEQSTLSVSSLLAAVKDMTATYDAKKQKAKHIASHIPRDGAAKLVDCIKAVIPAKHS